MDIHPCLACFNCWTQTPGECAQQDDMPAVLETVHAADVIVWAFPLYCYGVPAPMQALQERMLPLIMPHMVREGDVQAHPSRYPDKHWTWVVLSNSALPEQAHFDAVKMKFRQLAVAAGQAELLEPIVMGAGELLPRMEQDERMRPALEELIEELRAAGRQLAETGYLSVETVGALSHPLTERIGIRPATYARTVNMHWTPRTAREQ